VAGFVAVLVGLHQFGGPGVPGRAGAGLATPAQTASWIWALGLGMGISSIGLSWRYRQPVLTAWSTPGAALLAATPGLHAGRGGRRLPGVRALIVLAGSRAPSSA
jgi:benzoate membrane transport protein